MRISTFEIHFDKIKKILDKINDFCDSIEHENRFQFSKMSQIQNKIILFNKLKILRLKAKMIKRPLRKK